MGYEDEGDAEFLPDLLEFVAHGLAQFQIQCGQRLVQQQHLGFRGQGPGQRHPLLLAARKLGRAPLGILRQPDQFQHLVRAPMDFLRGSALHLEPEAHIVADAHVGKQRVMLEYGVDGAPVRRQFLDILAEQSQGSLADVLESADDPKQCGLAAARGTQQGEKFIVLNLEMDIVKRTHRVRSRAIELGHTGDVDGCLIHFCGVDCARYGGTSILDGIALVL